LAPNDGAVEVRCEFDDDTYSWKVIAYKEFVCSKPCISDDCNRNRIIVCAATTIPVMQEIDWKAPGEAGEPR
jgi:hypothetical protein